MVTKEVTDMILAASKGANYWFSYIIISNKASLGDRVEGTEQTLRQYIFESSDEDSIERVVANIRDFEIQGSSGAEVRLAAVEVALDEESVPTAMYHLNVWDGGGVAIGIVCANCLFSFQAGDMGRYGHKWGDSFFGFGE